jgi:hypothetical protein
MSDYAKLSDLVSPQGQTQIDIPSNVSAGLKTGMQLASVQSTLEKQKMDLESQKQDLAMKTASSVNSMLTGLARMDPKLAKMQLPKIREHLLQMGADPDIADYTISDDLNRKRQISYAKMAGGNLGSDPAAAGEFMQTAGQAMGWDAAAKVLDQSMQQAGSMQKVYAENKGKTDVAKIAGESKVDAASIQAKVRQQSLDDRNLLRSNSVYKQQVAPFEDLLSKSDSMSHLVEAAKNGEITSNANVKADLEDTVTQLSSRKSEATVSGSQRHAMESYYGDFKGLLGKVVGKPEDQIPDAILNELDNLNNKFKGVLAKQHETNMRSVLNKIPASSRQNYTDAYNEIRSGYGLAPYGGKQGGAIAAPQAPAAPSQAPAPANDQQAKIAKAKAAGYSDAEIQAYLKGNK